MITAMNADALPIARLSPSDSSIFTKYLKKMQIYKMSVVTRRGDMMAVVDVNAIRQTSTSLNIVRSRGIRWLL